MPQDDEIEPLLEIKQGKPLTKVEKIYILMIIVGIITGAGFGYVQGWYVAYHQTEDYYLNDYDWREHLRIENNVSPSYIYDKEYIDEIFIKEILNNET